MRSVPEIMNVIEAAELQSAETFFIYKPTWDLIILALNWSLGKTAIEINNRIVICGAKRDRGRMEIMKNKWQLIIETLKWVMEETDTNPIEARKDLIPFA